MRNGEESMTRSRAYTVGNNGWIRSHPHQEQNQNDRPIWEQHGEDNLGELHHSGKAICCPLIAPIALSIIDALETTMKPA